MWCNIFLIAVLFVAVYVGFTGFSIAKNNNNEPALKSSSDIHRMLEQIPEVPENSYVNQRPVGAMCYEMAAPLERSEYACPVCGEKTLYSTISKVDVERISFYRILIKKITKFDVELDETQLCESCNPKARKRELCLIVKIDKNAKPHKTCGITEEDIHMLYEYSEGVKDQSRFINNKKRLEELIGEPVKEIK